MLSHSSAQLTVFCYGRFVVRCYTVVLRMFLCVVIWSSALVGFFVCIVSNVQLTVPDLVFI